MFGFGSELRLGIRVRSRLTNKGSDSRVRVDLLLPRSMFHRLQKNVKCSTKNRTKHSAVYAMSSEMFTVFSQSIASLLYGHWS